MAALLEVKELRKRYGAIVVADDITFALEPNSCLGLIGPNGAGKSSLFNMLTGIVAPDQGSICFEGRDIGRIAPTCGRGSGSCARFKSPGRSRN
jgi:branched-chain amino acid transport system ATP-binding protein